MIYIPLASPRVQFQSWAHKGLLVKLELECCAPRKKGAPQAPSKGSFCLANQVTADLSEEANCVAESENPPGLLSPGLFGFSLLFYEQERKRSLKTSNWKLQELRIPGLRWPHLPHGCSSSASKGVCTFLDPVCCVILAHCCVILGQLVPLPAIHLGSRAGCM